MENIWEHPYLGMGHILGTDRTLRAAGVWYVLMHQGAFPDFPTLSTHSSSVFMCLNYFKLHFGSWMCNDVEWYIYIIQQSLYRLTILQIWANITKRCQIHEPVAGVCPVAAAVWASGSACASRVPLVEANNTLLDEVWKRLLGDVGCYTKSKCLSI